MTIMLKRVYDAAAPADGCRVLVDRLWPRGLRKEQVQIDQWLKEVAPSTALRQWLHQDPTRWTEFGSRYRDELRHNPAAETLCALVRQGPLTLVYGARDPAHNHALVLKQWLEQARCTRPT